MNAFVNEPRPRRPVAWHVRSAAGFVLGGLAAAGYVLWQLIVEQKLFLHTLLVERVGARGVPKLPVGYGNVLRLKLIMLVQQLTRNPEALKARQFHVYAAILGRLQKQGVRPAPPATIREYAAEEIDPRSFYREHVKRGVPCVIRGFQREGLERWTFAALAERYPDAVAQVLDLRDRRIRSVTLREAWADGRARYIPQQALLDQDPAFRAEFGIERSNRFFPVLGRPATPIACFLILGFGRGLNANFHCEESPNWYLAVSGSKRWTLVESEYSWLLYPAARGDGLRRFSEFRADAEGYPEDRARFPLAEYAPRIELELHPGDVLYFPAWMWHKTINLDAEGLGVTCRYVAPTVMSNRFFRALQMISPALWKSTVQVVAGAVRGDSGGLEEAGGFNEQEVSLY
jgi:hypothetical protein